MRPFRWLSVVIVLAAASGCGENGSAKAPVAAKELAVKGTALAQKEEVPEAGLCKEHGVLEGVCTKCNPKLAVIFLAKGDWCAKHGFPQSVCPICYPERGGRPAVDVTSDEAPADGTKVVMKSRDAAHLAGIETTKAVKGQGASGIAAPAVIVFDASRVAQVSALAPGVVKRVSAEIGTWVPAGASLAVIESAAVSSDQSRLTAALSHVQAAEAGYLRDLSLEKKGIKAKKEVLVAEQELRRATAELESLQASLRQVGAGAGSGGRYAVKAPFGGSVTQRTAFVGRYVDTNAQLFEIVDTSSMWAEVALAEADLGSVKVGAPVVVTLDGLSGREFRGKIAHIAPFIDPQTRTAKGRVRLANPGGVLKANMYGRARVAAGNAAVGTAVPAGAVQEVKSVKFVFVRKSPEEFEARRVQLASGRREGDLVEIASGLDIGEEVVVAGSFLLKTEILKDSIGAGCCEADKK